MAAETAALVREAAGDHGKTVAVILVAVILAAGIPVVEGLLVATLAGLVHVNPATAGEGAVLEASAMTAEVQAVVAEGLMSNRGNHDPRVTKTVMRQYFRPCCPVLPPTN